MIQTPVKAAGGHPVYPPNRQPNKERKLMTTTTTGRTGILPAKMLRAAVRDDVIVSDYRIPGDNFQPASLDLRLGETAHVLQCSFLPHRNTVQDRLPHLSMGRIDLRDGAILERNRTYLIPLLEGLNLPEGLRARSNPKSSTGWLDIFTRVITKQSDRFDDIPAGYQRHLYLEVFSRSFTLRVRTRLSLNQIRLFQGDPVIGAAELERIHEKLPSPSPDSRS